MPCPAENTLGHLVDGTLAPGDRAAVLAHVDACEICRSLVGALGGSGVRAPHGAEEPTIEKGTLFGRYMILERIGSGGMGVVYAAYDPQLDRRVAIKVLRARGEEARARLLREGKAMARLSSPHVITVLDVGTAGERDFVAMELVDGTTLRAWLAERERPWRDVLEVLLLAGRGLAAAHAEGLVHRDFKPDNVLVSKSGRVLVTDFGLARIDAAPAAVDENDHATDATATRGGIVGTPAYMAPEQIAGGAADAQSDQFAFAVTAWEALSGERPFPGSTLSEMLEKIRAGRPARGERSFPATLRRQLERALAADPAKRFASMRALLEEMEGVRGRARRARSAALALGLAAVFAAAFVGLRVASPAAPVCKAAPAKWSGGWDGAREDAVRGAFDATGAPYAADAFRGVAREMTAYRASWEAMYTDACEATRVRGEQSEDMMQLRMECLDDRLRSARALGDLLASSPDVATVRGSVIAAGRLPPISACADTRTLRERVRPPADPVAAARVAELSKRAADVDALNAAGRYAEAIALATPLLDEARALAYAPLEAEVLRSLGEAHASAGDFETGEREAKRAIVAAEAGGDLQTAAATWMDVVGIDTNDLSRFPQAHEAAEHARALVGRLAPRDALEARLAGAVGQLLTHEGSYPAARAELEKSLATYARIAPGSIEEAVARNALGTVLRKTGDVAGALAENEQALAILKTRLGDAHPNVAQAIKNVGNVYFARGQLDEAQARYEAALAIQERALGEDHPDTLSTRANVAAVLLRRGDVDGAVAQYERTISGIERRLGKDSPDLLSSLDNMGVALQMRGRTDESEAVLRRALAIAEKAYGPDHPEVEDVLVNLGDTLLAARRWDDAAATYRRAVAISEKTVGPDHAHTAEDLAGLASALLARGDARGARAAFERAEDIAGKAEMDAVTRAKIRFGLARALWETGGDRARARALAEQARAAGEPSEVAEIDQWLRAHATGRG